jgi:hypothetical protein
VYGDPFFYGLLCSDECKNFDDFCTATANSSGDLYVMANGFRTVAGSSFALEVAPPPPLSASIPLGGFPFAGSVDKGWKLFRVDGLIGGSKYTVSLASLTDNADLYVYDALDATHLICSSTVGGTGAESCDASAPFYNEFFVAVDGKNTAAGSSFAVNVVPAP